MAVPKVESRNNPDLVKKRLEAVNKATLENAFLTHSTDPFKEGDSLVLVNAPGLVFVINTLVEDEGRLFVEGYFDLDDQFQGEPSILVKQFKKTREGIEAKGEVPEDFFKMELEVDLSQAPAAEASEPAGEEGRDKEEAGLDELKAKYSAQLQEILLNSRAPVQLEEYFRDNPQDRRQGPDQPIKSNQIPGLSFKVVASEVKAKGKVTKVAVLSINEKVKRPHKLVEKLNASLAAIADPDLSDQVFTFEIELDVPGAYPEGQEPAPADPALIEVLRAQVNPVEKELLDNPIDPRLNMAITDLDITVKGEELNITFKDDSDVFCVVDLPDGVKLDDISEGDQIHLVYKVTLSGKSGKKYHRFRPKTASDAEWLPQVLDAPDKEARLAALGRLEQEIAKELGEAADVGLTRFSEISNELHDKIITAQTLRRSLGLFNKQYEIPKPKKGAAASPDPASLAEPAPEKKMGPPTFKTGDYLEQAKVERGNRNLVVLAGGSEYSIASGGRHIPRQADDFRNIVVRGLVRSDGSLLGRPGEVPRWWKPTAETYRVRIDVVKDRVYEATAVISPEEEFLYQNFSRTERDLNDQAKDRQAKLDQALISGLTVEDKSFRALSQELHRQSDERWEVMFNAPAAAELKRLEKSLSEEINQLQKDIAASRLKYLQSGADTDRKFSALVKELRDKILHLDYLMLLQESWQDRYVEALRELASFLDSKKRPAGEFARNFAGILREALGPFVYEAKVNERTGELDVVDLDARSAQDVFALAGVRQIAEATPVNSGETRMGAISLDTGNETGVGFSVHPNDDTLEFSAPAAWSGRALPGSEAEAWRQGTDVAELRAILSGPQAAEWRAWFDHHGPTAGQDNSTTKFVYETLRKLNVLTDRGLAVQLARIFREKGSSLEIDPARDAEAIRKAVARAVDFITLADNFRLLGMDNREAYLRSHRTLVGLYRRMQFADLVHLFYCHRSEPNYDGTQELTDEELRTYPLGHQRNNKDNPWLLLRHENKRKYIEGDPRKGVKPAPEIMADLAKEGFLVQTSFGQMYVNIDRRLAFGNETTWALSEGTCGCLDWQPDRQHFFVSFPSQDFSGLAFEPTQAKVVRGSMIIKPREIQELPFSLRELLHKLGVENSDITGDLGRYLERVEREDFDKTRVASERAPFRRAIFRDLGKLVVVLQGLGIPREDERYARNLTEFLGRHGARPAQAQELIHDFLEENK